MAERVTLASLTDVSLWLLVLAQSSLTLASPQRPSRVAPRANAIISSPGPVPTSASLSLTSSPLCIYYTATSNPLCNGNVFCLCGESGK